jgi:hypothetical protein
VFLRPGVPIRLLVGEGDGVAGVPHAFEEVPSVALARLAHGAPSFDEVLPRSLSF